ncbi:MULTISPECIES: hypothetical protein [Photorhabdus]|nr:MULTISPECIES: hypothetical protein [Photorhabdus]
MKLLLIRLLSVLAMMIHSNLNIGTAIEWLPKLTRDNLPEK